MHHIVYMSRATKILSEEELHYLCEQSSSYNRDVGVTGFLVFDGYRYMQVIEGNAAVVEDLMLQISKDTRHTHIVYMDNSPLQERAFAGWALACVGFQDNTTAAKLLTDVKRKVANIIDRDLMASFIGFAALAK